LNAVLNSEFEMCQDVKISSSVHIWFYYHHHIATGFHNIAKKIVVILLEL